MWSEMAGFRIYLISVYIQINLWTLSETAPPVINNPVKTESLLESTTETTLVFTLDVTDADGDAITCGFGTGSNPGVGTSKFSVQNIPGSISFGIYTVANTGFDSNSQSSYSLVIRCEANGDDVDETFIVQITENQAPVITNLPITGSITVPVATSGIGYNVFTVTATDAENDQISYTISCNPVTPACPFTVFSSGDILINTDISDITTAGYDVTVDVSDNNGKTGDSRTFTVAFSGLNSQPSISNLGSTITVPENSALSSTLETTTCTDSDATDILSYSMTCTPSNGLTYFNIDQSSGTISTSTSSTNYEYLVTAGATTFACTVTCSDGDASETASVNFDVTNVNEQPSFAQNGYTISADEGAGGTALQASGYVIIDEDNGDTYTFSIDCGIADTGYFSIDTASGILSYGSDYDVDAGVRPTSVSCAVTVTDSGGLTDTVPLAITINNINDNSPIFSPTTYQWFISDGSSIGTTVGQVTATDADVGMFGNISFSLDQSSIGAVYFGIDQTGVVFIQNSITPLGSGASVSFDVVAIDGGGTETRVTPSVVTVATTTTTTTTTTDRFKTFFDDGRNIAWFAACCIVVLATVLIVFWLCCTYFAEKQPSGRRLNCKCCECFRVTERPKMITSEPQPEIVVVEKPPVIVSKPKPEPELFNFWTVNGDL